MDKMIGGFLGGVRRGRGRAEDDYEDTHDYDSELVIEYRALRNRRAERRPSS